MELTKEEFEQQYATRSGLTVEQLHSLGGHAEPCDCNEEDCHQWKMVTS